jgi:hypothetical protein
MRWTFKVKKLETGEFYIEKVDKEFIAQQASIALKAYEEKGLDHQGPLENVLGLAAELTFKQFLKELGLKEDEYSWNERKPNYWDKDKDRRPWDIKLRNGTTFEIGAARPNHEFAALNLAQHKKESQYFVQVQIKSLKCTTKVFNQGKERWYQFDAEKYTPTELSDSSEIDRLEYSEGAIVGEARIRGFDKVETILNKANGWEFSPAGNWKTRFADAMLKPIDKLESLEDLRRVILSS